MTSERCWVPSMEEGPSASRPLDTASVVSALPSSSTSRLGRSPACGPSGFRVPCCFASGLKWPPADLKSGAVQVPLSWTCIPWGPGASPVTLTASHPPPAESESVATPTLAPVESTRLAVAVGAGTAGPSGPRGWPPPQPATTPARTPRSMLAKRRSAIGRSPVHRLAAALALPPLVGSHGDGAREHVTFHRRLEV